VAKHFELTIGETSFAFHRKTEAIAAEAALDGVYVVRTSLPKKADQCRGPQPTASRCSKRGGRKII
jgi:hypothetical protein